MNKVVFMFDQVINGIYNSTASKRIDEMPRNATNPIDIKENQMKKGTKLSSRMSCPACVPMLRERTRFLCFAYQ